MAITVVKHFVFSHKDGTQTQFAPGVHNDVADEIVKHPWIIAGADGAIELPKDKATAESKDATAAAAKAKADADAKAKADAEKAAAQRR